MASCKNLKGLVKGEVDIDKLNAAQLKAYINEVNHELYSIAQNSEEEKNAIIKSFVEDISAKAVNIILVIHRIGNVS